MVKAKKSRDAYRKKWKKRRKKTSRDREFLGDPWGDSAETRRVDRGHQGLQNTPKRFSAPMPFEGATTQILAKKGRGRPGQTNIMGTTIVVPYMRCRGRPRLFLTIIWVVAPSNGI